MNKENRVVQVFNPIESHLIYCYEIWACVGDITIIYRSVGDACMVTTAVCIV